MLLGLVRRRLRDEYGWTRNPKRYFGVTAVYSLENVSYPEGCSVEEASRLDCSGGLGAVMHMTAAMAMAVSRLAIERLLKPQAQPESAST
jgi:tRNA A37 threonylcarbamoyladenosine dehydratase